jgi:hypothetical protein
MRVSTWKWKQKQIQWTEWKNLPLIDSIMYVIFLSLYTNNVQIKKLCGDFEVDVQHLM